MNNRLQPCASHRRSRSPESPDSVSIASAAILASATSIDSTRSGHCVSRRGPRSSHRTRAEHGTSADASLIDRNTARGGRWRAAFAVNAARMAARNRRIRPRSGSEIGIRRLCVSPRAAIQRASARSSGNRSSGRPRGSISVLTSASAVDRSSPGAGGGSIPADIAVTILGVGEASRWQPTPTRATPRRATDADPRHAAAHSRPTTGRPRATNVGNAHVGA
jgi:hypothetical protein